MSEEQEGNPATEVGRTNVAQSEAEQVGWLRAQLREKWGGFRTDVISLDAWFEKQVRRVKKWFTPRAEHAQEFFGPAISGLVGCAVFALFDRFGVGNMEEGGSFHALVHEVDQSLKSPYFILALFLLAVALLLESSDGTNKVARWVVAPFLQLAEHVTMLTVGVVIALAAVESWKSSSVGPIWVLASLVPFMIAFALAMSMGAKYCRGVFSKAFFGRVGRKVFATFVGLVLVCAGFVDLVHYADKQERAMHEHSSTHDAAAAHAAGASSSGKSSSAAQHP